MFKGLSFRGSVLIRCEAILGPNIFTRKCRFGFISWKTCSQQRLLIRASAEKNVIREPRRTMKICFYIHRLMFSYVKCAKISAYNVNELYHNNYCLPIFNSELTLMWTRFNKIKIHNRP